MAWRLGSWFGMAWFGRQVVTWFGMVGSGAAGSVWQVWECKVRRGLASFGLAGAAWRDTVAGAGHGAAGVVCCAGVRYVAARVEQKKGE